MKFSAKFKKDYPILTAKLTQLALDVTKKAGKAKVRAAFQKYAELSAAKATTALTTGNHPLVESKVMKDLGQFIGGSDPNTVFLQKKMCDRFEKNKAEQTNPKMLLLLEATLLHEMVHWGDWKDGKDHPKEEGAEFEKEAYGKVIYPHY